MRESYTQRVAVVYGKRIFSMTPLAAVAPPYVVVFIILRTLSYFFEFFVDVF